MLKKRGIGIVHLKYVLGVFVLFAFVCQGAPQADLNVLIIGGSRDGGEISSGWWEAEKPHYTPDSAAFSATEVGTELDNILSGAGLGNVKVTVKDRYQVAAALLGWTALSYNLASWFHFPYPEGAESGRWADLRGEDGTAWDYVILIGDPYTMEYTPGVYAHGVAKVAEEVAKGSAETVLLMPWPAAGSSSSIAHYKEVVYRAGRSGGYKVAPAGLAWQDAGSPSGGGHPNADGAYIAAASIYSRVWNQSASTSSYSYDDTLADDVHSTVTSNVGQPQYTGTFSFQNPYLMLGDTRRYIRFSHRGTSTERRFRDKINPALDRCRVQHAEIGNSSVASQPDLPISWNHGRDGIYSESWKSYQIDPSKWQFAYGFYFHGNTWSYSVADANNHHIGLMEKNDSDLANRMFNESPSARNVPLRTLWAQIHQLDPSLRPLNDGSGGGGHLSYHENDAVGTYMYTLYSGRCPLDPKPATPDMTWKARKIGYETAWRVGRCQTRAPGFKVLPSAANALTITPDTTDTMTVQFILPPKDNVIVTINSSDTSAGIVGPYTLLFTPTNYDTPQTVTLTGVQGASVSAAFNIEFSTTSTDPVYDGLSDSWEYTCNRTSTSVTHVDSGLTQYDAYKNSPLNIVLGVSGASAANTVFVGPNHGTLAWDGANVVYTPDTDYVGLDGFAYRTVVAGAVTTGVIGIRVLDGYPDGSVRAEVTDGTATEEGPTTGSLTITREGDNSSALDVNFSLSGTATAGSDYTLSETSPVTIPAGQSSVVVTLTPVDDSVFGERDELATLEITAGTGYTIVSPTSTIVIQDNDNNAPEVNAGPDQTLVMEISGPWTPAEMATAAWYDASDTVTITESGGAVSQWKDKSGNGYDLSESTGSYQPNYETGALNGLAGVDFYLNKRLRSLDTPIIGFIIVVMKAENATWDGYHAILDNRGNVSNRLGTLRAQNNTGFWSDPYPDAIWDNGVTAPRSTTGYSSIDSAHIIGVTVKDAPKAIVDGLTMGNFGTGSSGGSGKQYEVVALSTVPDIDTRQKMEGYLAHKWGLESNLPAAHPFRSEPPGATGVTAELNGTATDPDGDPLTTVWTLVSTAPAGLESAVTFTDASAIDTTVTFTTEGVYTLRLTADDRIDQSYDDVIITVGTGGNPISDVNLPAGISLYGYTGENPIDAQTAFQTLIDNSQLSLVRWVDPSTGGIKELYYTTFPSPGWTNEIGNLTLGQGYVVKTTTASTLSINGNKNTVSVTHNLPAGYSLVGFNQETPRDAQTAFQALIDAGKLDIVRWIDPSTGTIKELYYTTFPTAGWVNEIGNLTEGQGYIIRLNAAETSFTFP